MLSKLAAYFMYAIFFTRGVAISFLPEPGMGSIGSSILFYACRYNYIFQYIIYFSIQFHILQRMQTSRRISKSIHENALINCSCNVFLISDTERTELRPSNQRNKVNCEDKHSILDHSRRSEIRKIKGKDSKQSRAKQSLSQNLSFLRKHSKI